MRRALVVFTLSLFASVSLACLWDSDTLREEATGKMDLVRAVTGRFVRWPARYYEIRLQRVKRVLNGSATHEQRLDALDDGAVALHRLGKDAEAIQFIERKRTLLEETDPGKVKEKEHWYRYYSNVGTFWLVRWITEGRKNATRWQIERAEACIEKALAINPDAHFGREWVQLRLIQWVKQIKKGHPGLADFLKSGLTNPIAGKVRSKQEAVTGLTGLVVLGAAWEMPDIYLAILSLMNRRDQSLSALVGLRVEELKIKGHKSLVPGLNLPSCCGHPFYENYLEREYSRLRMEAESWKDNRDSFVLARFEQGLHPDVNPNFWEGYKDSPAPTLQDPTWWERVKAWWMSPQNNVIGYPVLLIAIVIGFYILKNRRKKARSVSS